MGARGAHRRQEDELVVHMHVADERNEQRIWPESSHEGLQLCIEPRVRGLESSAAGRSSQCVSRTLRCRCAAPDSDCTSLVISSVNAGGFPLVTTATLTVPPSSAIRAIVPPQPSTSSSG